VQVSYNECKLGSVAWQTRTGHPAPGDGLGRGMQVAAQVAVQQGLSMKERHRFAPVRAFISKV
jgi:hypothetical protein